MAVNLSACGLIFSLRKSLIVLVAIPVLRDNSIWLICNFSSLVKIFSYINDTAFFRIFGYCIRLLLFQQEILNKLTVTAIAISNACDKRFFAERENQYLARAGKYTREELENFAAMMCYIQLSIIGCRAIIKIGDSLLHPMTDNEPLDESYWLTPMHLMGNFLNFMSIFEKEPINASI